MNNVFKEEPPPTASSAKKASFEACLSPRARVEEQVPEQAVVLDTLRLSKKLPEAARSSKNRNLVDFRGPKDVPGRVPEASEIGLGGLRSSPGTMEITTFV